MYVPRSSVAFVVLIVALAACSGSASPSPAPSAGSDRLTGTDWGLQTLDDQPLPSGIQATLSFNAGTATGSSGCNTFTGAYTTDGPALDIGPLATTRKACDPAVMTFEQTYLAALDGVTAWAVPADAAMGTELTLTGGGPKLVFGKP